MITKDLDSSAIDGPLGRMPSHGSLRTGPPKAEGMCLSYWLQGVRNHYLLDHRTTEALPETADVVIIGSGVSTAQISMATEDQRSQELCQLSNSSRVPIRRSPL